MVYCALKTRRALPGFMHVREQEQQGACLLTLFELLSHKFYLGLHSEAPEIKFSKLLIPVLIPY